MVQRRFWERTSFNRQVAAMSACALGVVASVVVLASARETLSLPLPGEVAPKTEKRLLMLRLPMRAGEIDSRIDKARQARQGMASASLLSKTPVGLTKRHNYRPRILAGLLIFGLLQLLLFG